MISQGFILIHYTQLADGLHIIQGIIVAKLRLRGSYL